MNWIAPSNVTQVKKKVPERRVEGLTHLTSVYLTSRQVFVLAFFLAPTTVHSPAIVIDFRYLIAPLSIAVNSVFITSSASPLGHYQLWQRTVHTIDHHNLTPSKSITYTTTPTAFPPYRYRSHESNFCHVFSSLLY